ncbi:hypothetical protein H0E87_007268 [Populus deltoides]|uniref:Cyanobacterial aminoacyl-tRNA synthetase CAAD domain-containing protein n=1 Tax=Populus deltoides TaxID=3696 RepID=A0A8T2ZAH0_POPDE|nr:hypothetical protein H0E87_007268 [Populus deltoides]
MASITASLPSPPLLVHGKRTLFSTLQTLPLSPIKDRQNCVSVVVRATGESSESSPPLGIVKSVKNIWDDSEDRLALVGLGFAALVAIWTSAKLIPAIDKLPVVPSVLELIGILFSSVSNIPQLMVSENVRANEKELLSSCNNYYLTKHHLSSIYHTDLSFSIHSSGLYIDIFCSNPIGK